MALSWRTVSDAFENEFVFLSVLAVAPIAAFAISPTLVFVPYLLPLLLFHKRNDVVGLGPIRDESPSEAPATVPVATPRPAKKPVLVWVCLECWVVFAKRDSTIPDCPRCQMPYDALKLAAEDVAAARAMGLAPRNRE